jgi:hypothetical protein
MENSPMPTTLLLSTYTSYFLLPTSYFLLPTSYFLLPTSYFLLPDFLLPTSYFLLPTSYFLLVIYTSVNASINDRYHEYYFCVY